MSKLTKYGSVVQDQAGNGVAGLIIYVTDANTGAPAAIFTDPDGLFPVQGNQVPADGKGRFELFVTPGVYNFTAKLGNQVVAQDNYVSVAGVPGSGVIASIDNFAGANRVRNFIESANANPGVQHVLLPGRYDISEELPTITANNVKLSCPGAAVHDTGSLFTGAVLRWVGASGATMMRVSATAGNTNQRLSNFQMNGIALDCNGLANIGLELRSVTHSDISVSTANARFAGVYSGVVSVLGEAVDTRNNQFYIVGRQIEFRGGSTLVCDGNATGNTSFNDIVVDAQHADGPAVILQNSDNNAWWLVRTTKIAGGSATDSVSLLGGPDEMRSCRAERFHVVTGNTALHVYGTDGAVPFAYPSTNHVIYTLDIDNGTPIPVVQAGGSVQYRRANGVSSLLAAIGLASGDTYANTLLAKQRLAGSSFHTVNDSDDHMRMSNSARTTEFGINFNGAHLRFSRLVGAGGYQYSLDAIQRFASSSAARAALGPGVQYRLSTGDQLYITPET